MDEQDSADSSQGRLQQPEPSPSQPDIMSWDLDVCTMSAEDLVCHARP